MFRFDASNPQFLLVYTGDEHAKPDDYRKLAKEWAAALDRDERFGVVVIYEPHEHHEHDEDEHRQHEAEITRITNDFRRDYRERTMQSNLGFARVYSAEIMEYYEDKPDAWEKGQEGMNRYAQYSWGIPGRAFTNLDDAQTWLLQQIGRAPSVEAETVAAASRVGLFYGSSTGVTEIIAENIRDVWAQMGMEPIEAMNIGYVKNGRELLAYDYLILGISTWNIGQLQDDWDILFPQLDKLDFSGKTVAIFGIGDQENYADNFLDAVGILGDKLIERGAKLVGYWIDEHFEFAESKGFVDGKFMGLGIDEVNQRELSAQRVRNWVAQIIGEFALQPSTQTASV